LITCKDEKHVWQRLIQLEIEAELINGVFDSENRDSRVSSAIKIVAEEVAEMEGYDLGFVLGHGYQDELLYYKSGCFGVKTD
jgi:hypothetical protein